MDINDLEPIDAEICRRLAMQMERRQSSAKEDQLIIVALRLLANRILERPAS